MELDLELPDDELLELDDELSDELLDRELIYDLKLDNLSQLSSSELELESDELLLLLDDECLDEPLNLQRRPLEPLSPLPLPYPPLSYPLSSYHSNIFKTLFSLFATFKSSRSLFLSSVSTVPITS